MIFTVPEMEMLCLFHAGTRKATIEMLEKAAAEMDEGLSGRRVDMESAIGKLERMRDSDTACIAFNPS